ncbi:ras GEF [Xylona heveae TC161]|uniref:Class E vacuolar protein-sorting machinery protein HSE1 n=1 Tax=Xylona heveae (strain CBS 132557 / TC161) TaxID=1328760 RepID=A0A165JQY6_XYLHT|nr:ras GEF [Xylona heveae TC161]KZF26526.1 ras GEF [Xylona heveae TC161]
MYVRALYDYQADDRTSLSFRQGDIIQVITQLESGWWDGVINGVRGWFPSNYCALVSGPEEATNEGNRTALLDDGDAEDEDGLGGDQDYDDDNDSDTGTADDNPLLPIEGTDGHQQEEAAFWIPQATPDGRLFYFNTLTGVTTMELPLESPTSATETGPRDRTNVHLPDQSRLPPELMAGGYERDEDETTDDYDGNSASELEGESIMMASQASLPRRRRRSYISDGVSPATSMDSMSGLSTIPKSTSNASDFYLPSISMSAVQQALPTMGVSSTSFAAANLGLGPTSNIPRSMFADGPAVPLTWNRLVENMRSAVERYRQAINNGQRAEYVKRAEDISDHLRLLLAAGSGTTDNHSGNPSIISTNKALYPHFRDMMSRFSKLVLSSHIAATDWPAQDSYAKCLFEADGVLQGVYSYVEVARQQRGEDIPRLTPGFVLGNNVGGNWQNNGMEARNRNPSTSISESEEAESFVEPNARLDIQLLERMDEMRRVVTANIKRLDEQLALTEKIITPYRHRLIGDAVCVAGGKVIESMRPWLSTIEAINLRPLKAYPQLPELANYSTLKQKLYDLTSDLVIGCQAVSAPLADEWAELRGESLENRLVYIRSVSRHLESCMSQLGFSLQLLAELMPQETSAPATETPVQTETISLFPRTNAQPPDISNLQRPRTTSAATTASSTGQSQTYSEGPDPVTDKYRRENSKVKKFFGEVPAPILPPGASEPPAFLKLDHEDEIAYDAKFEPPLLKGGTLVGLVEQLTRHDRLDSPFNNTFLLTYRSFTTAEELFELVVKRFTIQPPPALSQEDFQTWVDRKQKPIRFRVVNILKSWFDNYWMEFNDDASKELLRRVYSFVKDSIATTSTPGAQGLMTVIEQRLQGQEAKSKRLVLTLNQNTPAPIMPKNMKKLKFLDIDVTEFARQLTIIESRLYGKIKPTECLNKIWQKKIPTEGSVPAANVRALILHSNQLTNWVAEMILTQQDIKKRVVVIKHFVSVADKCRQLNNFSTLTSIISALGTAPIHRLARTWAQVPARTQTVLEQMRRLMGSTKNFGEYRETLHLANPPCIPFFGVYLTDLVFIEDGIPSTVKKTNLINFAKRAKTAEVIRDIQQYQNVPYSLQAVPELQEYILSNMQAAGDVHEMYEKSLAVEPREREDEKIARLLSESGFL